MFGMRFLTVLCSISLLGVSMGYISMEIKQPPNGVAVGYWGPYAVCDINSARPIFVRAFSVKSDGGTSALLNADSKIDRLGVTAVAFNCDTVTGVQITSTVGNGGSFYPSRSCGGSLLSGLQINVNPSQSPDALGVEDVRVICLDGSTVEGLFGTVTPATAEIKELIRIANEEVEDEEPLEEFLPRKVVPAKQIPMSRLNNAYWGTAAMCTTGLYICGLQTRVDQSFAEKTISDLRGLTDIKIYCCN